MKRASILIAFFLIASSCYAQLVFNPVSGPTGGNIVAIERTSTSKLFALTQKNLYESTNNGNSWAKVGTINLQNQGPVSLLIDKADKIYVATKSAIHTSLDAGSTWTELTPTGDYNPSKRLQKNEATGSLFIIGYYTIGGFYGLQKSSDDGLTWADVSPVANQINDFAIKNAIGFSHIYASPNGGARMYKSTDDAAGWNTSDTGLPNSVSFTYERGIVVNKFNGKIYCLPYSPQGVFESSDEGVTWASVTTGSPITFGDGFSQYGIFASQTSGRIFIRHNNDLYYNDNPFGAPATWTLLNLGNTDPPISLLSYSSNIFLGLNNYGGSSNGMLKSTNSGSNWTYADVGILEYSTQSSLRANDGRLITANGSGTISSSTNDGVTWSKKKVCDCGLLNLIKKTNGDILAIGDRTYQSVDNGLNWSLLGGPHVNYIDRLATSDGGTTIFGTGGFPSKLYKSTDGGVSFSELVVTGISGVTNYYGIAADNSNNVYLYTDTNEVYSIPGPGNTTATKITNSGLTNIFGVRTVGANVYIVGDTGTGSGLAKSTNQGATWTIQVTDDTYELVMISDKLIFARTFDNQISFSNDAGVNWNLAYDPGISFFNLSSAFIDDNGIAYVSASEGPMYKSSATVVLPNKPTNFKTIATGDNTVYLEWDYDNSGGAVIDGFIIERKLTSGGTFVEIGFPENSERYFVDRSTIKNTGYDYRVIADNLSGANISNPISLTTSDDCALTIPDNRSWAGSVDGGAFTLDPISIRKYNNDYYEISDVTAGSLASVLKLPSGPDTFLKSSVKTIFSEACGTPFIERDRNGDVYPTGNGTWNGSTTITLNFQIDKTRFVDTEKTITLTLNPLDPAPEVPQNVFASVLNNTAISVQWSVGDFQQKYYIERSLTSVSGFSQVGTVNYPTLTFTDPGPFVAGTTYFYRVKSENNVPVQSGYSTESSIMFNQPVFVLSSTIVSSTFASAPSAAWGDFDNDGFEDLIMPVLDFVGFGANEPLLFKNNAGTDFQLVTGKIPAGTNYFGPTIGDYNNDDLLDVFATGLTFEGAAQTKNGLIRNDGNLDFTEVASSIVVPQEVGQTTFGGSWVDVNNDGYLDLFIPYEDVDGQKLFDGSSSGVFTENSTAGALISDSFSKGGAFWADYDNDGDMDVFVSGNAPNPNRLYRNDAGVFTHITPSVFDSQIADIFTVSWGDYNNDQFLDLFLGDEGGQNLLYKNNGDGTFTKQPTVANSPTENVSALTFGSAWGDVDNDGDLDLLIVNAGEANVLYINQGSGTFSKITNESITGFSSSFDLGAAFADYDNDGHLDVIIGALTFPQGQFVVPPDDPQLKLYRNNVTTGNWIKVKLIGAATTQPLFSNRAAIGARVKIVTGGLTQIREISSLTGTGSQGSLIAHFGLGSATTITSIQINWPSGIIQNISSPSINQMITVIEDDLGPVASVLSPLNGATGVNANTTLSITLDELSTPIAAKKINLFKTSNLVTPITSLNVTTGVVSGNTFTFTLPQNLEPSTSYSVSVDAGAFNDVYGNASSAMTTSLWQFTSAAGPVVTLLSPADLATDVAINTLLEITFDKVPTAVAGKNLNVTSQGGTIPTYTLSTNSGTIAGNKVTFTLPGPLGPFTTYDVNVDAGAFTDANGNATATIVWSFITIDNSPPVVNSFSPPAVLDKGFGTSIFEASVMDNSGNISAVVLSHRGIGGNAYADLTGVYNSTTMMYEFSVQESFFDATGMECYLKVYDAANNETLFPDNPDGRFKTFLNYKEADSKIPPSVLGFGGQIGNWKIFAIPFDLGAGNSVTSVFDELASLTYKIDWRMLTYTNATAWGEYPTDFAQFNRGKGYFINIKSPVDLFVGAVSAPNNSRSNLFSLNLKTGWNQIGNPYLTSISWNDAATLNSLTGTSAQLKKFASGSYTNATDLLPFEGGFVFVDADVTVLVPFAGQTTFGGRKKEFTADLDNEAWQVPLKLIQGNIQNELSGVGMNPDASVNKDDFDDINPPRFVEYAEINFAHPEHFAKRFSLDVVPTQNEYTWEFTVDTNLEGDATLAWNPDTFGSGENELYLLDVRLQKSINMKEVGVYTFDTESSNRFKIFFGKDLEKKVHPNTILLGEAFPNPTSGTATIPFALPQSSGMYGVRLEVFDMMGRKVGVIHDGLLPSGFYESQWDTPVERLVNGLYTYRLAVSGNGKNVVLSNKIILKK